MVCPSSLRVGATFASLAVCYGAWVIFGAWREKRGGKKTEVFLNKTRQRVQLAERTCLTHDTRRLRFALPSRSMALGLPTGKHIKVSFPNQAGTTLGMWNGRPDREVGRELVRRNYTPTTSDHHRGYFDLVLKIYEGGVNEKFPDGGKVSQQIDKLRVGDWLNLEGPFGLITYHGHGRFSSGKAKLAAVRVGMIAGGTGITPMLQVLQAVLRDASDATEVSLLFANQTEDDILLRETLDSLHREHKDRFRVLHYTVDRAPEHGWAYSTGFVSAAMIKEHMPAPGDGTLIICCGPPPMIKFACKQNLEKLGYSKDQCLYY